jgi:nucleoside-diphosphate-sugar epimerase
MQRILVTGATGFLGGAVARRLQHEGISVLATGRNAKAGAALEREGIAFRACDLATDPEAVQHLAEGCDAVVHSAALTSPWGTRREFQAANVTAVRHIIEACVKVGVTRLVHISSPSVFFDFKDQPSLKEDAPWAYPPANLYIETKREAEALVLQAVAGGLDAIMLRPKALFGPGDSALLPRVVRVARRGFFPLFGEGDPLMDLTWIGDAAEAVRLALRAPASCRGKVYHITSGDPQPRNAVLSSMLEGCGLTVRFRRIPLNRALAVASVMEFVSRVFTLSRWEPLATRYSVGVLGFPQTLDISAARADLGYAPDTKVIPALRECGLQWRAEHAPQLETTS